MKKRKLGCTISILIVMMLTLGLLSGCGSKKETLSGAFDNYDYEVSLVFSEDGTMVISSLEATGDGTYELDKDTLTITVDGESMEGTIDDEGDIYFDEYGYFIQVDGATFVPDAVFDAGDTEEIASDPGETTEEIASDPEETPEEIGMEIAGTAWEVDDHCWNFYEGNTLSVDDEIWGTYVWEGTSGQISIDDSTTTIMLDLEGLYMEGEDGDFYLMTYLGEIDSSYVGNSEDADTYEEDGSGAYSIEGAYDNDTVGVSAEFDPLDNSYVISDGEYLDTGFYTVHGDGYMALSGDLYDFTGYYDSSDDTFMLDEYDGYFYWVSETGYY